MQQDLIEKIEKYYELTNDECVANPDVMYCVDSVFSLLNDGNIRAAEKVDEKWIVNSWVKKAILLAFRIKKPVPQEFDAYDKIALQKYDYATGRYRKSPLAFIRDGVYIGDNTVVMPSYINVASYIDSGTMIDMGAVIGSCAQIGKNCHISATACIGGVLEPAVATPTIVEDGCFIGVHSSVLEGVIVEKNSVIASGVDISASTKIIDRNSGEIITGRVPAGSVVVSGSYPSNGINISCAVIIKKTDARALERLGVNHILRR